ncbi:MAG: signal recognition particle [Candidatus Thermoplasmatota archaeon]|jgi:signal recognition particle subunit SRP19|nr:signal recognition particle [Candidatus Thermoplasmatota archaeon]
MKITLYSAYFDPLISRRLGRRVALNAAKNFSDKRLQDILQSLQVKFDSRSGRYPRIPWKDGVIYDIEAEIHKTTLIKAIERKLL